MTMLIVNFHLTTAYNSPVRYRSCLWTSTGSCPCSCSCSGSYTGIMKGLSPLLFRSVGLVCYLIFDHWASPCRKRMQHKKVSNRNHVLSTVEPELSTQRRDTSLDNLNTHCPLPSHAWWQSPMTVPEISFLSFLSTVHCSVSRWRPQKVDKRMVLVYTHGLFIT